MQASYMIGLGTAMKENQLAAQIAARHNIFPQMAPYMSWIFLVLVGIDPGQGRPARGGVEANASFLGLGGIFFILGGIFLV